MIKRFVICGSILIILIIIYITFPIFTVENVYPEKFMISDNDKLYCVLQYQQTSGAGWIVIDSNDDALLGENIILNYCFDPRLLKSNEGLELEMFSNFFVTVKEVDNVVYEDQDIKILYAEKITIVNSDDRTQYKLCDLSVAGIAKAIGGLFNRRVHNCY